MINFNKKREAKLPIKISFGTYANERKVQSFRAIRVDQLVSNTIHIQHSRNKNRMDEAVKLMENNIVCAQLWNT